MSRKRDDDELGDLVKSYNDLSLQRSEAEEALHESNEQIRLLMNSTAEAIYGLDLDGICTWCNSSCLTMLGYESSDELLGKNTHQMIHHTRPDGSPSVGSRASGCGCGALSGVRRRAVSPPPDSGRPPFPGTPPASRKSPAGWSGTIRPEAPRNPFSCGSPAAP